MSTLNEYLAHKAAAFRALKERIRAPGYRPVALRAHAVAEGRSGVRRIRIRDFQVITDSPRDFVGYDLGPSSPELALGALSSCITHSFLIQAAALGVPLDSLEVTVTGQLDQRAGSAGHEDTPVHPHALHYTVHIDSEAADAQIEALHRAVEKSCPILNLLRRPQVVEGAIERAPALSPEGVG